MTLIDLLSVIDENTEEVRVFQGGAVVAHYDGRDSIPERFNSAEVERISATRYILDIVIK
jgi:hypothetical protein